MLFKKKFLHRIESGSVRTAFRKWNRPSVSESGTLLTPVGQLRIKSMVKVDYSQITEEEVNLAGYRNRKELEKELALKDTGDIYKIEFYIERADPRIELRKNTTITNDEMEVILSKLKRYDTRGKVTNWTFRVLEMLESDPGRFAIEYSSKLGYEKEWFKLNIRKLKNLGLTVSHSYGYEISPRGKVVLNILKKRTGNNGSN